MTLIIEGEELLHSAQCGVHQHPSMEEYSHKTLAKICEFCRTHFITAEVEGRITFATQINWKLSMKWTNINIHLTYSITLMTHCMSTSYVYILFRVRNRM